MQPTLSLATVAATVVTIMAMMTVAFVGYRNARRRRAQAPDRDERPTYQQPSAVRLLTNPTEVTAALTTAAKTERHLLDLAAQRYAHYQQPTTNAIRRPPAAPSRRVRRAPSSSVEDRAKTA